MRDFALPDLSFPMVQFGNLETPWDLSALVYRGGAKCNSRYVQTKIENGNFGTPITDRLELVTLIHNTLSAELVGGGSKTTTSNRIKYLRNFFSWVDSSHHHLSIATVEEIFRHWCDHLVNLVRLKKLKNQSAYFAGTAVSKVLDDTLERSQSLIHTTRLRSHQRRARAIGIVADRQDLSETFEFGHLCQDIINSLTLDAVFGPLPVMIYIRDGRSLKMWSGLQEPNTLAALKPGYKKKTHTRKVLKTRADWESDRTFRTRYSVINIRLTAELLVFIAQTGMNLSQAHNLKRTQLSYKSTIDGYEVRDYKARRKGEVLFEIYAEYRIQFQKYLEWRDIVFGTENDRLFPFIRQMGATESTPPSFKWFINKICFPLGITFVGPQRLRGSRVNWMLRRSRDPELTAELAQHTKQTLLRVYEKPSLQVAQIEVIQFWKANDPRLIDNPMPCPALGVCDGKPKPYPKLPPEAPKADCRSPSGCLFCEHHRDIDSEDYIWSLACMRLLNTIVLQGYRPPIKGRADSAAHVELTLEVLTRKLEWFRDSNLTRQSWVEEAIAKLSEGEYHPHWRYLLEDAQGV